MLTSHRQAAHKSVDEIARNIAKFLSLTCTVQGKKQVDLSNLLPDLNMREQFSFALLMEAREQGWERADAEKFFRFAVAPAVGNETTRRILSALEDPKGKDFAELLARYGCDFSFPSPAYWSTALAVAIDADAISVLMDYLRGFVFCILDFAYMDNRTPEQTYVWRYYESFQRILDKLSAPEEPSLPIRVCALGGTVGKRSTNGYMLSLGVDLKNPDPAHMAWNVRLTVTLTDRYGNVIDVIEDRVQCIDPASTFHYGITRKIQGNAVAHFSATATADAASRLSTPIMQYVTLSNATLKKTADGSLIKGRLTNGYDRPLSSLTLHYQLLNKENKILGGGKKELSEAFPSNAERLVSWGLPICVKDAARILYSVDFNAQELL